MEAGKLKGEYLCKKVGGKEKQGKKGRGKGREEGKKKGRKKGGGREEGEVNK